MEKLSETINTNNRTYTQVKRTDTKAMYISNDDVIEVFYIKILPEQEIYGRLYPEREGYPNSEEFGKIAWCYTNRDLAEKRYNKM